MKLISLTTTGFKKLDKFECDFTSGLNVIVGDNAAGKSTLLQAIEASLYGPSVLPGNKDHITTWGKEKWSLSLTFQIGEDEYTVTRTKSTAKLIKVEGGKHGDSLEANGSSPVTKRIEELLGLSSKDFNLFMQSRQGETTGLLTFGATALSRKVEEFAGVSLIDRVQQLANEEHRTGKAQADAVRPTAEALHDADLKATEAGDEYAKTLTELTVAQDALSKAEAPESVVIPEGDPKAMRQAVRAKERAEQALAAATSEENHALETLATAKQVASEVAEPESVDELITQSTILSRRIKWISRALELRRDNEREVKRLQGRIEDLTSERDELVSTGPNTEELPSLKGKLEELDTAMESLRNSRAEVATKLNQLKAMDKDAECPTCGTFLAKHDPAKLADEIKDAEVTLAKCDAGVRVVKAERAELVEYITDLEDSAKKLETLQDSIDQLKGNLAQVQDTVEEESGLSEDELEQSRTQLAELRSKISGAEEASDLYTRRQRELSKAQTRANSAAEEREDASDALAKIGEVPEESQIEQLEAAIEAAKEERQKLQQAAQELKEVVTHTEARLRYSDSQSKAAVAHLRTLADAVKKADAFEKEADQGGRLSRFLRDRRGEYIAEVWNTVIGVASKQVRLASQGAIQSLSYQDGEFVFEEEGMLAPVGCASGAQKAHIGVALRIGLSRALYGSDALLIFDEPTESMREHNATGLSASLAGAGSQVLLITHREQDQDLAHNIIEVS